MHTKPSTRIMAVILTLITVISCLSLSVLTSSAATYRTGAQSGPSSSYKGGRYYANYQKVPITGDNRTDLVAMALSQLGYQEGAANGNFSGEVSGRYNYVEFSYNMGDLGLGYGGSDYPWCASFVSWCLYQSRCTDQSTYKDLGRYHRGDTKYIWKEISCSQWVSQLKTAGYFKYSKYEGGSYTPKYGDLVYFQNSAGVAHIGICLYVSGGRIYTVEGNTSDASGLEANGGGVYFKNYALTSSYLYGYGVLPYKTNSSVPKIDYSGANPTPGLYVANASKYIYTSETASTHSYTIPRFSMFEITKIGTNGTRLYGTFKTSTGATVNGWINNNSDRIIQLSSSEESSSGAELAKETLSKTVKLVNDVKHYDYAESTLVEIRTAYKNANALLADASATEEKLTEANTTLTTLLAKKGSNTTALNNKGIYVSGCNGQIKAGDCFIYSPTWQNGLITVDNANIRYTVNVVVGWDPTIYCNVVKSVTEGKGNSTPSIQLGDGEWLIAAHDWEIGTAESDNPVEYSGTNYTILKNLEVGSRVYLSGCTILGNGNVEPGAFIKFAPPSSVKMTGKNVKVEAGKFVLFTPEFNDGAVTVDNSGIDKALTLKVEWSSEKSAWVVVEKIYANASDKSVYDMTLVDGQVLISGVSSGAADDSSAHYAYLDSAKVGQKVIFSGITPSYGVNTVSVAANISFEDIESEPVTPPEGGEGEGEGEEEKPLLENLALNKPYEAETAGKHTANLTDGVAYTALDFDGKWFGFNKEKNVKDGVGYVTIDLGARYNLDTFKAHIYPHDDGSGIGSPEHINVSVSNNGTTFRHAGNMNLDPSATGAYWASYENAGASGRYVRFEVSTAADGSYWVFLNELEVYGTVLEGGANIALGAEETLAPAGNTYTASLTDGIINKELKGENWFGFLSSSADEANTENGVGTAVIDLGSRFKVSEVRAYVFAGENTEGVTPPEKVSVYVSIDGDSYLKAGELVLIKDATAPYWASIENCDAVGRYLKLQVECAGQWTLLGEVEAYGEAHVQVTDNNIALEKPCTVAAFSGSPYTASLTDGIASDVFQFGLNNSSWFAFLNTGDTSGNTNGEKGIVTIDLGGQAEITGTRIHVLAGANDAGAVQPTYINVYISDDGGFFDYIGTINPVSASEPYWAELNLAEPVYARYVKYAFGVPQGKLSLLNEIKVSGTMLTSNESDEPGSLSSVTLAGDFNSWNPTPNMKRTGENTVSVSVELEEGSYAFKILQGSDWFGNNGIIDNTTEDTSEIGWLMSPTENNCTLKATGGTYTFLYNTETHYLKILHTPETYFIRGDFNNWGTDVIMNDMGNGIYETTLTLDAGTYEFKAADSEYFKQWPEFNDSITLSRRTDVTFTLNIFDNTLRVTTEVNDFIVTFMDHDGTVISTQTVRKGGSATEPEIPKREGYTFSNWSEKFTNVTGDVTVRARYTSLLGTLRVSVVGGTGFTISVGGSAARPQGSSYRNTRMTKGVSVTLTANLCESEFIGWMNDKGVIVSPVETLTFITTGNDSFEAVYATSIETVNRVTFKNDKAAGGNGQILDMQYYAPKDKIAFPEDAVQTGYDFLRWSMTEAEIQAELEAGRDVVVTPVFEVRQIYVNITLTNGTVKSYGGMKDGKYLAYKGTTVAADTAPEGMKFAYWADADGNVKSYDAEYKFYPAKDTELVAVYVAEDEEIIYDILMDIAADSTVSGNNISFVISWNVPESEGTFVKGGVLVVDSKNYDPDTFVVGTMDSNVTQGSPTKGQQANQPGYSLTKQNVCFPGSTWYGMTWVQYTDKNGNLRTAYSDIITVTKY